MFRVGALMTSSGDRAKRELKKKKTQWKKTIRQGGGKSGGGESRQYEWSGAMGG